MPQSSPRTPLFPSYPPNPGNPGLPTSPGGPGGPGSPAGPLIGRPYPGAPLGPGPKENDYYIIAENNTIHANCIYLDLQVIINKFKYFCTKYKITE